jgi:hypothetical protein
LDDVIQEIVEQRNVNNAAGVTAAANGLSGKQIKEALLTPGFVPPRKEIGKL